jgi:hypothetical protein
MRLAVYDKLRQAHSIIKDIETDSLSLFDEQSIHGINAVLYMAEALFVRSE